jgi:hypothetical protein
MAYNRGRGSKWTRLGGKAAHDVPVAMISLVSPEGHDRRDFTQYTKGGKVRRDIYSTAGGAGSDGAWHFDGSKWLTSDQANAEYKRLQADKWVKANPPPGVEEMAELIAKRPGMKVVPIPASFWAAFGKDQEQKKQLRDAIFERTGVWWDDLDDMMEFMSKVAAHHARKKFTIVANPAYPALSYEQAHAWESLAKEKGVSKVARSARGFMRAYQRAGSFSKLSPAWKKKRQSFIARHMAQGRSEALWENGEPSRRALALLMWAYKPPRKNPVVSNPWKKPPTQVVDVYRNLNNGRLSVKNRGKGDNTVAGYFDRVEMKDVDLVVSAAALHRMRHVLKKRWVVAYARGTVTGVSESPGKVPGVGWTEITFNPWKYDSFIVAKTEKPVFRADQAVVVNGRVYGKGLRYAKTNPSNKSTPVIAWACNAKPPTTVKTNPWSRAPSQVVDVYRNLSNGRLSVKNRAKGDTKVAGYFDRVTLKDAEFVVSAKRLHYMRHVKKRREVVAYARGDLASVSEEPGKVPGAGWTEITFNPWKYDTFIVSKTEKPVFGAKEAVVVNGRVYAKGLSYTKTNPRSVKQTHVVWQAAEGTPTKVDYRVANDIKHELRYLTTDYGAKTIGYKDLVTWMEAAMSLKVASGKTVKATIRGAVEEFNQTMGSITVTGMPR